ncbi:hypothetical protein M9H77_26876 [Catharanthus roseus]|uniref:Uncharacterized protein n=1 Tax=Catharanthus roseus TaxID=4058 RepID=A0ACC0ADM4_CATRO|nr:hypothetical protein M9H77_26876 [Catharanthus roseus]
MYNNHWGYGNFSPHDRSYEHNSYDFYEGNILGTRNCYNDKSCKRVPRNYVRNGRNYVNLNERRSYQTLGTTSRPPSYHDLKLPLLCGTFGPYDYEVWEQQVESLFYSYCVREEERFELVLKSLSYEANVWWDSKCENRMRIGAQLIKDWILLKQSLTNRFGVENQETRVDEYYDIVSNYASCMPGIEDDERRMEEELGTILEDLSISPSLNPSLSFYKVSFEEFKSLLVSYTIHVDVLGDICDISLDGNVFLLEPSILRCLSPHVNLEDLLMGSGAKFDPYCYGFRMLDHNIVGFGLDCALFDILHDECLGKLIEDVDYVILFLDAFKKNLDGVIPINQCFHLFTCQFEFSYNEHKLSIVVNSLNLSFENTFEFKFYHLHFKDFLLKGFGIMVKVGFGQVCKDFLLSLFVTTYLKEWFSKLFISFASLPKNSSALTLKHELGATLFSYLDFKEFFDKMVFKQKGRPSWNFGKFYVHIFSPHL